MSETIFYGNYLTEEACIKHRGDRDKAWSGDDTSIWNLVFRGCVSQNCRVTNEASKEAVGEVNYQRELTGEKLLAPANSQDTDDPEAGADITHQILQSIQNITVEGQSIRTRRINQTANMKKSE